jgi:hypothetical protein
MMSSLIVPEAVLARNMHPLLRLREQALLVFGPRLAAIEDAFLPVENWTTFAQNHPSEAIRQMDRNIEPTRSATFLPSENSLFLLPIDLPEQPTVNPAPAGQEAAAAAPVQEGANPIIVFSPRDFAAAQYFFLFSFFATARRNITARFLGVVTVTPDVDLPDSIRHIVSLSGLKQNDVIALPAPRVFLVPSGAFEHIAMAVADAALSARPPAAASAVAAAAQLPSDLPAVVRDHVSAFLATSGFAMPTPAPTVVVAPGQSFISESKYVLFDAVKVLSYLFPPTAPCGGCSDLARSTFFPELDVGAPLIAPALKIQQAVGVARDFFLACSAAPDAPPSDAVLQKMVLLQFTYSSASGIAATDAITAGSSSTTAATPSVSTLSLASFGTKRDQGPIVDMAIFDICWYRMSDFYEQFYGPPLAAGLQRLRRCLCQLVERVGSPIMTPPRMVRFAQTTLAQLPNVLKRHILAHAAVTPAVAAVPFATAVELTAFLESACTIDLSSPIYQQFAQELQVDIVVSLSALHLSQNKGRVDSRPSARRRNGVKRDTHAAGFAAQTNGDSGRPQQRPRTLPAAPAGSDNPSFIMRDFDAKPEIPGSEPCLNWLCDLKACAGTAICAGTGKRRTKRPHKFASTATPQQIQAFTAWARGESH